MAVIIQRIVGARHGDRFYPSFSGVARSHNFYPVAPMRAEDGIAAVALGLGRTVVEGGACLRFCPRYPQQRAAARLGEGGALDHPARLLGVAARARRRCAGVDARRALPARGWPRPTATLAPVASTYSPENDAIYDGIGARRARASSPSRRC